MFGTIYHLRPKPGHEPAVLELFDRWQRERKLKAEGHVGGYLFRPADKPSQLAGVAVFSSRETYFNNAKDPEQDRWYRQLREHLETDPEWEDGEVLRNG